jgi:hypothetical protein
MSGFRTSWGGLISWVLATPRAYLLCPHGPNPEVGK